MPNELRFYAADETRLPIHDYPAVHDQMARFVGWAWDGTIGDWKKSTEPTVVRFDHVYVTAAKDGHLRPADEATAVVCGMKFEAPQKKSDKSEKA